MMSPIVHLAESARVHGAFGGAEGDDVWAALHGGPSDTCWDGGPFAFNAPCIYSGGWRGSFLAAGIMPGDSQGHDTLGSIARNATSGAAGGQAGGVPRPARSSRGASCPTPPSRIRTCAVSASGSCRDDNVQLHVRTATLVTGGLRLRVRHLLCRSAFSRLGPFPPHFASTASRFVRGFIGNTSPSDSSRSCVACSGLALSGHDPPCCVSRSS